MTAAIPDDYEYRTAGLWCRTCCGELSEADLCFRRRCPCGVPLVERGQLMTPAEYLVAMRRGWGASRDGE